MVLDALLAEERDPLTDGVGVDAPGVPVFDAVIVAGAVEAPGAQPMGGVSPSRGNGSSNVYDGALPSMRSWR